MEYRVDGVPRNEKDCLQYIADSPAQEHGGFHENAIAGAKWALERIEELEAKVEKYALSESARVEAEIKMGNDLLAAEAQLAALVDAAEAALDFAWDELTTTDADDNTMPVPHWCDFVQNPENGQCSTHEGVGDLHKLRDTLDNLPESARKLPAERDTLTEQVKGLREAYRVRVEGMQSAFSELENGLNDDPTDKMMRARDFLKSHAIGAERLLEAALSTPEPKPEAKEEE